MDIIVRNEDSTLYCNVAASFPDGVLKAHQLLHQIYPAAPGRQYFGISWPENGGLHYKAAVSLAPDEKPVTDKFEKFIVKKGLFLSERVPDFMNNIPVIQTTFEKLVRDPRVEPAGYCLEEYLDEKDMLCMVPLNEQRVQDALRKELTGIYQELYETLIPVIKLFTPEQFNTVPPHGGWTPAQVTEHIIKATDGIPDANTTPANRLFNEKDHLTREVFLNYEIKMPAPEFLLPEMKRYNQEEMIAQLQQIKENHLQTIRDKDLLALCLDFELPVWGTLTRYEWLKFIAYHTTRHTQQLKNIHNVMNGFSL